MAYALGIDLGTTFTAAAVARDGRATAVPLGTDRDAMPTAVYVLEDGTTLVGEPAVRRAPSDPTRVAREFKRRVGDPTPILVGGAPWSAEALSAAVLRSVVDTVIAAEGGPPDSITVTHPANWGAFKRDVLEHAVGLAGLPGAQLLSEPEAAAFAYASRERVEVGEYLAIYDLGGGTFDVTIVYRGDHGFAVAGQPDGIERLGGIDFDEAVVGHVRAALGNELAALDPTDPAVISAMAELRTNCIRAKEALSADTEATIAVPLPAGLRQVRLTRAEFEDMIRGPLGQTVQVVERAIANAGLVPAHLSRVLLVGGSSRIPLVGQLVASTLARPITIDAHPKHVVASGAALQGLATAAPAAPPVMLPPPPPAAVQAQPAPVDGERRSRRGLVWAALAVTVLVIVAAAFVLSRRSDTASGAAGARANVDHWHAAYAISVCGTEEAALQDVGLDTTGTHTHGDGVIHVHPFLDEVAGDHAVLQVFLDDVGVQLSDTTLKLPDGTTKTEGEDTCDGKAAEVAVGVWNRAADADAGKPPDETRTSNLGDVLLQDGQAITISFNPRGAAIPGPQGAAQRLAQLTDTGSAFSTPGSGSSTGSSSGTTATEDAAGKPCIARVDPLPSGAPDVPVQTGAPPSQLVTDDLRAGTGATVTASSTVTVDYIGVACSTGRIFDSSYARNQPATFALSDVIPGWQQGLAGMQVGGRRLLGIPPSLAYGSTGAPPDIAPNETLWFVVDIINSTG